MSIETDDFELTAETTAIQGFWLDLGSTVEKDSGWIRIEWLLKNRLECVTQTEGERGELYRNPVDGTLWHYYPVAPNMQDGGPPALERIDEERAQELFNISLD